MDIQIIKPGMLSTIQDLGRIGYRDIGLPVAGAMDKVAASTANLLLGNPPGSPVIEIAMGEFEFIATSSLLMACCGAGVTMTVAGVSQPLWKTLFVPAGTLVTLNYDATGTYAYLSVAGGWDAPESLGSYSTYLPAGIGQPLQRLQLLHSAKKYSAVTKSILQRLSMDSVSGFSWGVYPSTLAEYQSRVIRLIKGNEYDWFDEASLQVLTNECFVVDADSARMAVLLNGPVMSKREEKELLSTAVDMGTIQVNHAGRLMMLMADCQTTGGYPRIAQVGAADLPVCAQLKPGDEIRFTFITPGEAEALLLEQTKKLDLFRQQVESMTLLS